MKDFCVFKFFTAQFSTNYCQCVYVWMDVYLMYEYTVCNCSPPYPTSLCNILYLNSMARSWRERRDNQYKKFTGYEWIFLFFDRQRSCCMIISVMMCEICMRSFISFFRNSFCPHSHFFYFVKIIILNRVLI